MIRLEIANNTKKSTVLVRGDVPITKILSDNTDVALDGANIRLDGAPLSVTDLGKSLFDLGVKDEQDAMLVSVVKAISNR